MDFAFSEEEEVVRADIWFTRGCRNWGNGYTFVSCTSFNERRYTMTVPVPDHSIELVNNMGTKDKMARELVFLDQTGKNILDEFIDMVYRYSYTTTKTSKQPRSGYGSRQKTQE